MRALRPLLRRSKEMAVTQMFACGPAIRRLSSGSLTRSGVAIDIRSPLITDQTVAGLFFGRYEAPERRQVTRYLRAELPIIELGASLGFMTAFIARRRRGTKHIAVEAHPELIPLLRATLDANGIADVEVVHAAIDYSGEDTALLDVSAHCSLSSGLAGGTGSTAAELVRVPAITLQRLIDAAGLAEFALIADIEGAELGFIDRESDDTIDRCKQMIIELHHCRDGATALTPADLADRLEDRWHMTPVRRDWDVWVFERRA